MKRAAALPLQQHPFFADALRWLGRDVCQIAMADAHQVVAVRLFGQLMASRGPVWVDAHDDDRKANGFAQTRLRLVNADTADDTALTRAGYRRIATHGTVAELDLTGCAQTRLTAAHGKWRNRWRRACEAPVTLRYARFSNDTHDWLLRADRAQQREKRFRSLPHALTTAYAATNPNAAQVHVAHLANKPVAAMLFLLHAPVATYHIGWISDEGRAWGLHHRLLLDAANRFANQGYSRLDLGGVDTEATPGLARFKIGSGARIRPLGGTWLRTGRASR